MKLDAALASYTFESPRAPGLHLLDLLVCSLLALQSGDSLCRRLLERYLDWRRSTTRQVYGCRVMCSWSSQPWSQLYLWRLLLLLHRKFAESRVQYQLFIVWFPIAWLLRIFIFIFQIPSFSGIGSIFHFAMKFCIILCMLRTKPHWPCSQFFRLVFHHHLHPIQKLIYLVGLFSMLRVEFQ